jgi:hypothetical protein
MESDRWVRAGKGGDGKRPADKGREWDSGEYFLSSIK